MGACLAGKKPSELAEDDPHLVLRVGPGTTFLGLVSARDVALAEAEAAGDDAKVALVHASFERFVGGARERFEAALAAEPDSPAAAYELANFCQTVGDDERAEGLYRQALDNEPGHVDASNNLAVLLQKKGDGEAAEALLRAAADAKPEDVDVLFNLALFLLEVRGDAAGANEVADRIVGIRADLAEHALVKDLRAKAAAL